jgi:hypothetical protein
MIRRGVLAALLIAAATGSAEDKPLATRIREANLKATKAIATKWNTIKPGAYTYEGHARTLVALTLLRAGGPEERAAAKKLLDEWWLDAVAGRFGDTSCPDNYGTYVVSLGISALEGLSLERMATDDDSTLTRFTKTPVAPENKKRLEIATEALASSAVVLGEKERAFGYHALHLAPGGTRDGNRAALGGYDNSNTQFAALAFHDAARAGIKAPDELVDGLVEHFADEEEGSGQLRWKYHHDVKEAKASMTFAGLSSLAIARSLGSKDARLGPAIQRGLDGAVNLARTCGPGTESEHGWGNAYTLYSLEKALDLLEVEAIEGKDWFAPIAERVLKLQQKNGLWEDGDLIDSCFYVLFLVRATIPESRLGPPRTVVKVAADGDALVALKGFSETPNATTRAALEAACSKLAAQKNGDEALLLATLAELARKGPTREVAKHLLLDICGKDPSQDELALAAERLEKLRGAPTVADFRAALEKTTLLPVRSFAAFHGASPALVLDSADGLYGESILETAAGSRCAHAFEAVLRKAVGADLPPLSEDVRPSELRFLVRRARERFEAEAAKSRK